MRTTLLFFMILQLSSVYGQSLLKGMDAEPMHAMPVVLQHFNNPALLSLERQTYFCAGQQRMFMLNELSRNFLTLHLPFFDNDAVSGAIVQTSNPLCTERFVQAGYSRHFGEVVDVFQGGWMYGMEQGEGYGSKYVYGARTGLSALITGLRISTLLDIPVTTDSLLFSGSVLKAGVAIKCSEKCWVESSGSLQAQDPFVFGGGVFYKAGETFEMRTGVITKPFAPFAGFAFCYGKWKLDLSSRYHPVLGMSPQIAIAFFTGKNSK